MIIFSVYSELFNCPVYPSCGGHVDDVEMWKKYIQSPGFYANNGYQDHQECTWVIKVR